MWISIIFPRGHITQTEQNRLTLYYATHAMSCSVGTGHIQTGRDKQRHTHTNRHALVFNTNNQKVIIEKALSIYRCGRLDIDANDATTIIQNRIPNLSATIYTSTYMP